MNQLLLPQDPLLLNRLECIKTMVSFRAYQQDLPVSMVSLFQEPVLSFLTFPIHPLPKTRIKLKSSIVAWEERVVSGTGLSPTGFGCIAGISVMYVGWVLKRTSSSLCTRVKSRRREEWEMAECWKHRSRYFFIFSALVLRWNSFKSRFSRQWRREGKDSLHFG